MSNSPHPPASSKLNQILGVAVAGLGVFMAIVSVRQMLHGGGSTQFGLTLSSFGLVMVGAVIISRTGHRIGWVAAISGGLQLAASAFRGPFEDVGWGAWLFSIGLLIFLFPDGRAVSPRWKWIVWVTSVALVISSVWDLVDSGAGSDGNRLAGLTILIIFAFVPVSVASLVVRYVRSSGIERLQMKWFVFAAVGLVLLDLVWEQLARILPFPQVFWDLALASGFLAMPIAIGIAILRYKLYEIDRIISRTLSYAIVVGLLGTAFFGMVTLATSLLPSQNALAVAGSTLVVAAVFNPFRSRIQRWVDQRFNRSGYQTQLISEQFNLRLRDSPTTEALAEDWKRTANEALQPEFIGFWLKQSIHTTELS